MWQNKAFHFKLLLPFLCVCHDHRKADLRPAATCIVLFVLTFLFYMNYSSDFVQQEVELYPVDFFTSANSWMHYQAAKLSG